MTTIDLDTIVLDAGAHPAGAGAGCLLEWASALAGEPWTDHPACVSPALAAYGRALNDWMPHAARQALRASLPRLLGTAGDPARDRRRAYLAADRAVRDLAPRALDAAGLGDIAARLRGLAPITDPETAAAAYDAAAIAAAAGDWQPALDLFTALIDCP